MEAIRELAEQLPTDASTNIKDITLSVSPAVAREFWQRRNKVANFLKHADRDASSLIALDEVDNFRLIMHPTVLCLWLRAGAATARPASGIRALAKIDVGPTVPL